MPRRPRRRIGTQIDVGRVSRAVQRPGIDPRVWAARAFVSSDVQIDEHGYFVDVTLMPGKEEETARIGCMYAGVGFGAYLPLERDDEVLVVAPYGTPQAGLVVVARLHSKSDPPPSEVKDRPADVMLLMKKDANIRIAVQGNGNAVIRVDDGKVLLASEQGTLPVARKGDRLTASAATATWATTVETAINAVAPGTFTPLNQFVPADPAHPLAGNAGGARQFGIVDEGSQKVESA